MPAARSPGARRRGAVVEVEPERALLHGSELMASSGRICQHLLPTQGLSAALEATKNGITGAPEGKDDESDAHNEELS